MSEKATCPGYLRKSWLRRTCKYFEKGKGGWVGSSSFCTHPLRKIEVCLTGGKEPQNADSQ